MRRHAQVARQREQYGAADHMAVQARDGDRFGALDRLQRAAAELRRVAPRARAGARAGRYSPRRILAVGAGTERRAVAAENDDRSLGVALQLTKHVDQLFERDAR